MGRESDTGGPARGGDGAAQTTSTSRPTPPSALTAGAPAPDGSERPRRAASPDGHAAPGEAAAIAPPDTPLQGAGGDAVGALAPAPAHARAAADGAIDPPSQPLEAAAPRLDFSGARLLAADAAAERTTDPVADPALLPPDACALLTAHSFGDTALLVPDTASARRLALDTIRTHHRTGGRPKRRDLLVLTGGLPLPPEFATDAEVVALSDDPGAVEGAITPRTAGLWIAPLRRAAGLAPVDGGLLATLRTLADDYGLPLVFDETDAGLGRTGMAFAHEWRGVTPDLMLVGEGAGLPLAALVLSARHARALPSSRPSVDAAQTAAAGAMLAAVFAEGFEARIQALGWLMEDRLATLRYARPDLFREVVGLGLAQGLACAGPAAPLAQALAARGLDVAVFGDVLAFLPPLDVSEADITAAADILAAVVAERVQEEA